MCGSPRRAKRPGASAPARDDGGSRITRAVLEAECVPRAGCGVDQRAARQLDGLARFLLVAIEDDGDVHLVEHAGVAQRAERVEENDVAALHVDDAGTFRRRVVQSLEALERTVRLEHRIEMSDQQDLRTGAGMLGY